MREKTSVQERFWNALEKVAQPRTILILIVLLALASVVDRSFSLAFDAARGAPALPLR